MQSIYLDYAATTPVLPEVVEAMNPYFTDTYGNPSSLHHFGVRARKAVEDSREIVARFIGTNPETMVFTSGGTESDNLAIFGTFLKNREKNPHIITTAIEHSAVLNTCQFMEQLGADVTYLPVNAEGLVDPAAAEAAITDQTVLISIMYANNEIGTIQPVEEIGQIANSHGIPFHTDAVQALSSTRIDAREKHIDMLSAAGHKLYAPKGVGFFFLGASWGIKPIMHGGDHEYGIRPSTENVPGIVGLATAIDIISRDMNREAKRERELREYIIDHVLAEIDGSSFNGSRTECLPGIASLAFDGVLGYDLAMVLDREGIAVSTGSACHSLSQKPSHVLRALGLSPGISLETIRVSIGRQTTQEEVDYFLEKLHDAIKELRAGRARNIDKRKR
jgi:cysteine desulfurase